MTRFLVTLIALSLLLGCVAPKRSADREPTVLTKPLEPGSPIHSNAHVIYYDDDFLLVSRDFGVESLPSEPGLFVHSKAHGAWRQILRISTRHGKFGTSNSDQPEDKTKLLGSSVSWNFTDLANQPWADIPLRTSGCIVFPDKVEFDRATRRYKLSFLSAWQIDSAQTILWINQKDLAAQFNAKKSLNVSNLRQFLDCARSAPLSNRGPRQRAF
jgi:hypothetical protein